MENHENAIYLVLDSITCTIIKIIYTTTTINSNDFPIKSNSIMKKKINNLIFSILGQIGRDCSVSVHKTGGSGSSLAPGEI